MGTVWERYLFRKNDIGKDIFMLNEVFYRGFRGFSPNQRHFVTQNAYLAKIILSRKCKKSDMDG